MKIAFANNDEQPVGKKNYGDWNGGFLPPPISLQVTEPAVLAKDQYLTMKLRLVPSVDKSPTYDLVIPYFKNGTPKEWLKFQLNLNRVFVGQNLTTAVPKYAMIRRLLMGDVLSTFNAKARVLTTENNANLKICLNAVTETVFLKKAMQTQKRYMRRMLRKPVDLKI